MEIFIQIDSQIFIYFYIALAATVWYVPLKWVPVDRDIYITVASKVL